MGTGVIFGPVRRKDTASLLIENDSRPHFFGWR
jgi:hypothetical protein